MEIVPTDRVVTAAAAAPPPTQPVATLSNVAQRRQLDVQAIHAAVMAVLAELEDTKLEPKHAIKFFEHLEKKDGTSQQHKGDCMACGKSVTSTGAFKMQSHIIECPLMLATV